ncbi:hypothetical protein [Geodermatophilus bullaregiensis]|nr:hypothetical protein [Geodermatophilus bullaregiensis]
MGPLSRSRDPPGSGPQPTRVGAEIAVGGTVSQEDVLTALRESRYE